MIPKEKIDFSIQSLQGKSVFLTGGTGFFGKSLLDFIIKYEIKCQITILSRNTTKFLEGNPIYISENIKFIDGDIQNFEFPKIRFDYIFHFATPADAAMNMSHPLEMSDVIVEGTKRILDFAVSNKIEAILFASSGAVYGEQPLHVAETFTGSPLPNKIGSSYGISKRFAEFLGIEYARKYNFSFKVARCFAFVGPHLSRNGSYAIGNFLRDSIGGNDIQISGDGTPLRSYLYSEDLIVWLIVIFFKGNNLEPYNVGSDKELSIFQVAEIVRNVVNKSIKILVKQKPQLGKPVQSYVPSIEKARSELELQVWTDLEAAIRKSATNREKHEPEN